MFSCQKSFLHAAAGVSVCLETYISLCSMCCMFLAGSKDMISRLFRCSADIELDFRAVFHVNIAAAIICRYTNKYSQSQGKSEFRLNFSRQALMMKKQRKKKFRSQKLCALRDYLK
jgi:hypothetical protein